MAPAGGRGRRGPLISPPSLASAEVVQCAIGHGDAGPLAYPRRPRALWKAHRPDRPNRLFRDLQACAPIGAGELADLHGEGLIWSYHHVLVQEEPDVITDEDRLDYAAAWTADLRQRSLAAFASGRERVVDPANLPQTQLRVESIKNCALGRRFAFGSFDLRSVFVLARLRSPSRLPGASRASIGGPSPSGQYSAVGWPPPPPAHSGGCIRNGSSRTAVPSGTREKHPDDSA